MIEKKYIETLIIIIIRYQAIFISILYFNIRTWLYKKIKSIYLLIKKNKQIRINFYSNPLLVYIIRNITKF